MFGPEFINTSNRVAELKNAVLLTNHEEREILIAILQRGKRGK